MSISSVNELTIADLEAMKRIIERNKITNYRVVSEVAEGTPEMIYKLVSSNEPNCIKERSIIINEFHENLTNMNLELATIIRAFRFAHPNCMIEPHDIIGANSDIIQG